MSPEKNTMPNYFNEWSTFDDNKSHMTIITYIPVVNELISVNENEYNFKKDIEVEYNFEDDEFDI